MSNKFIRKSRGTAWNDMETSTLLDLWEERDVESLLENPKLSKGGIYEELSSSLEELGFSKSVAQIRIRMKTLKKNYRNTKTKLSRSGNSGKKCKFYEKLNSILGTRPASSPLRVIDTGKRKRGDDDSSDNEDSDTVDTQSKPSDLSQSDSETDTPETSMVQTSNENATQSESESPPTTTQKRRSGSCFKKPQRGQKQTRMERALGTVISTFTSSNESIEAKHLDLEKKRIEVELKKTDVEKLRIESDERNKQADREHQFRMMEMILKMSTSPQRSAPEYDNSQLRPIPPVNPSTGSGDFVYPSAPGSSTTYFQL